MTVKLATGPDIESRKFVVIAVVVIDPPVSLLSLIGPCRAAVLAHSYVLTNDRNRSGNTSKPGAFES